MRFHYTARTRDGNRIEGTLIAEHQEALRELLEKRGETLESAEEAPPFYGMFEKLNTRLLSVKLHEKIVFARNMSTMLRAGLPLSRALLITGRQTKNKKFQEIISAIADRISKGGPFHDALNEFPDTFSSLFVSMVRAGEESGKLNDSLLLIAGQMERTYELKKKITGALIYPSIIIIAMVIIAALMLVFVVPTLESTFTELNVDLPVTTQFIIVVSKGLRDHTLLFLGGFILLCVGLYVAAKKPQSKKVFDFIVLRLPIIGTIIKEFNAARTARTLSSLLSSGVEVSQALDITKDVLQNNYYKRVLNSAKENIEKGIPVSHAFASQEDIYPLLLSEMMEVGEETGKLSEMLLEVAVFFEGEVESATKDMSTIIEPFLMILVGVAVGFFAVSMLQPMYSLSNSI
ncbi:MAG: type II secretion system F family protein [Parcubacteria group bacterium]|nr:type II secretion system F family protein [Parcubacteria group bacterium]